MAVLADFETLFEIISSIRNIRNSKQIAPKVALPLAVRTASPERFVALEGMIQKMANVSNITYVSEKPASATSFLINRDEFYVDLADELDPEQEFTNAQKDLDYQTGFRDSVMKKLSNEKFVANAKPEVVERERQKIADADAKIAALQETLRQFSL